MSASGIMNADMATVGRWLREGFAWWVEELSAMLPASLRPNGSHSGPVAFCRPGLPVVIAQGGKLSEAVAEKRPRSMALALPAAIALERDIGVPAMRAADLRNYVALEADRLFPLPAETLLTDARIVERTAETGQMRVRIAAITRTDADQAIAAAGALGIVPSRLSLTDDTNAAHTSYDFTPRLRAEGALPPPDRSRQIWWALVAFAFAFNVGLLVWRDQQGVDRLRDIVTAQEPGVTVYRAMAGRAARLEQVAQTVTTARATHAALPDLAAATVTLPPNAWVQHYEWNGRALRLSGYMRPAFDIVGALRRNPRFLNVRSSTGDVQADAVIGHPFDVTLDLRQPHP